MSVAFAPVPAACPPLPPIEDTDVLTPAPAADRSSVALVGALRARNPRAAGVAWTRLWPLVWRLVARFGGLAGLRVSTADRHDLCQEVFLRFFARIDELRNPQALRGFVAGICLGVANNEARRARIRRAVQLTASGNVPDFPVRAIDPEACETKGRLGALLAGLGAADRELFVMRYIEQREMPEVARACALSLATVKRRLARTSLRIGARMRAEPSLAPLADALLRRRGGGASARGDRSARARPPAPRAPARGRVQGMLSR